jgi:hypothetical protein
MAFAAVAGLASAVGSAAAGLTIFGLSATTLGGFAAAFALGAGLSMVSRALMPKPSVGQQLTGMDFTVREPDATRKIIYGRTRVGGAIVFIDTTDGDEDNEYIHMVLAFAGHEIDGFEEIYANQEKIWDDVTLRKVSWQPYLDVNVHNGDQTTADAELVSRSNKWTTDHVLNDTAYVYIRLKYDAEFFSSGLPNFSAVIRGKKVLNPITSVTEWTQNPALCAYDYLLDTKYGLAEPAANINLAELTAAVALCDQPVDLAAGGNQPRYTLDGVLDTGNSKKDNIEAMLSAMSGRLVHSGGEYFISGGAYVAPTITIDESVMVGSLEVQTKQSRRGLYNGVKGVFRSEEDNYNTADYPAQLSSTFSTEDGDPIYLDMALPFTTNNIRAQRIAKLALLQSRQQTTVTIPCNLTALKFKAGDNVMVSNTKMGWDQKVFQVIGYELSLAGSGEIVVNVQAIETAAAIYDWTSSDEIDYLTGGELSLYTGKVANPPVAPLVLTASSSVNDDGTITPTIDVSWSAASDAFTDYYSVEWYNVTTGGAAVNQQTKTTDFTIGPVMPNMNYAVSVYAYNGLGVKSTALSGNVTTVSDTTPNLPSLYQAVTDSASAPTELQFTTVAGRSPKNGDVFLATDTTTATYTVHPWTYSTTTSSWNENTNFISGDLIVDGSITGDQITANSIQVNKLTGDVTELYPFKMEGSLVTTTLTAERSFSLPTPELSLPKRQRVTINVLLLINNSNSFDVAAKGFFVLQVKSKGSAEVVVGTLTTDGYTRTGRQKMYVSGNKLEILDSSGALSNVSGGGSLAQVYELYYDSVNDRTYITANLAPMTFVTGQTLYFNQDNWLSSGVWINPAGTTDFEHTVIPSKKSVISIPLDFTFAKSTTATEFQLAHKFLGAQGQSGISGEVVLISGTIENMA